MTCKRSMFRPHVQFSKAMFPHTQEDPGEDVRPDRISLHKQLSFDPLQLKVAPQSTCGSQPISLYRESLLSKRCVAT